MADRITQKLAVERNVDEREDSILQADIEKQLKYDTYKISCKMLDKGGESQLFYAQRNSDNASVVAKIYLETSHSIANREAREELTSILSSDQLELVKKGILPLLDFGTIDIDIDGRIENVNVDIIPLCVDGNMENKKLSVEELKEKAIPSLYNAIEYMHDKGYIHRDIKPANIYFLDGNYVLGDFGTATKCSENRATETGRLRGTVGYMAPEVNLHYANKESDYYSLGCTIASLYNGEHIYQEFLNSNNIGSLYHKMQSIGLVLNCPKEDEDIQILVDLLTVQNVEIRNGKEVVEKWLDNSSSLRYRWESLKDGRTNGSNFSMLYEENRYNSIFSLVQAFLEDWETAKDFFYEDRMFASYIINNQISGANEFAKIQRNPPATELEKEKCFSQFLYYFTRNEAVGNNPPIYWMGKRYDSLKEIAEKFKNVSIENPNEANDSYDKTIVELLKSGYLSWRFSISKECSEIEINTIKLFEESVVEFEKITAFAFYYSFTADGENEIDADFSKILANGNMFLISQSISLLSNTGALCSNEMDENSQFALLVVKDIISAGMYPVLLELLRELEKNISIRQKAQLLYETIEQIVVDKSAIREHYLKCGPFAHIYWLKTHKECYSPKSSKAVDSFGKLEKINASANRSIAENAEELVQGAPIYKMIIKNVNKESDNRYKLKKSISTKNYSNSSSDYYSVSMANFLGYVLSVNTVAVEYYDEASFPIGFVLSSQCIDLNMDYIKKFIVDYYENNIKSQYQTISKKTNDIFLYNKKHAETTSYRKLRPKDLKDVWDSAEVCKEIWEDFENICDSFISDVEPLKEIVSGLDASEKLQFDLWLKDLSMKRFDLKTFNYSDEIEEWRGAYRNSIGCCKSCGKKLGVFSRRCSSCGTMN